MESREPHSRTSALTDPPQVARRRSEVLLEFPDASTRIEDIAERARTLTAAGAGVTVVVAGAPRHGVEDGAPELPGAWRVAAAEASGAALRAVLARHPGASLTCAGDPPRGFGGAAELGGVRVRRWPTRLTGEPERDRAILATAVAARARGITARTSLWDGRYVLAPGITRERDAHEAIDAFAAVASDHATLDLVLLGDRGERDAALARRLGIHSRVHWAGWSPLRAECAWLAAASVVILAGSAAAEAPLVVRALASGSPVAVTGGDLVARSLAGWLAARGVTPAPASLAALLAGGEPVKQARARALEIAAGNEWSAVAAAWRDGPGGSVPDSRAA